MQAVEEIDPVGQARECIVEGLVADLLLGLFTVGDVVEHHEVGGFVIPNGLGGGHLRHTETPVRTQDVEFGMGPGAGVTEGESFEVRCRVPQGLLGGRVAEADGALAVHHQDAAAVFHDHVGEAGLHVLELAPFLMSRRMPMASQ